MENFDNLLLRAAQQQQQQQHLMSLLSADSARQHPTAALFQVAEIPSLFDGIPPGLSPAQISSAYNRLAAVPTDRLNTQGSTTHCEAQTIYDYDPHYTKSDGIPLSLNSNKISNHNLMNAIARTRVSADHGSESIGSALLKSVIVAQQHQQQSNAIGGVVLSRPIVSNNCTTNSSGSPSDCDTLPTALKLAAVTSSHCRSLPSPVAAATAGSSTKHLLSLIQGGNQQDGSPLAATTSHSSSSSNIAVLPCDSPTTSSRTAAVEVGVRQQRTKEIGKRGCNSSGSALRYSGDQLLEEYRNSERPQSSSGTNETVLENSGRRVAVATEAESQGRTWWESVNAKSTSDATTKNDRNTNISSTKKQNTFSTATIHKEEESSLKALKLKHAVLWTAICELASELSKSKHEAAVLLRRVDAAWLSAPMLTKISNDGIETLTRGLHELPAGFLLGLREKLVGMALCSDNSSATAEGDMEGGSKLSSTTIPEQAPYVESSTAFRSSKIRSSTNSGRSRNTNNGYDSQHYSRTHKTVQEERSDDEYYRDYTDQYRKGSGLEYSGSTHYIQKSYKKNTDRVKNNNFSLPDNMCTSDNRRCTDDINWSSEKRLDYRYPNEGRYGHNSHSSRSEVYHNTKSYSTKMDTDPAGSTTTTTSNTGGGKKDRKSSRRSKLLEKVYIDLDSDSPGQPAGTPVTNSKGSHSSADRDFHVQQQPHGRSGKDTSTATNKVQSAATNKVQSAATNTTTSAALLDAAYRSCDRAAAKGYRGFDNFNSPGDSSTQLSDSSNSGIR
eukprot:Lankesteria_metandrocarpae@DN2618_c0_g1_i1.p1